jgi:hypothetical protein
MSGFRSSSRNAALRIRVNKFCAGIIYYDPLLATPYM